MKVWTYRATTWIVAAMVLSASCEIMGCSNRNAGAVQSGTGKSGTGRVLRIGYGKGGSMEIVRQKGVLEKRLAPEGVTIQWLNFPMGPQMMEAIGTGSLDIGSAAATPPIFAQAAGVPFVYAANIPTGRSGGGAILVPKDFPIQTVADLRGKRIAFQPGSVWQYCLVKLLEQVGVEYKEVLPVKMPPADAFSAFNSGSVDAWVQGEPYITLSQRKSGARILARTNGVSTAGGFYLAASATVKSHPEWIRAVLEEVKKAGAWAKSHPHDAALLTASRVGLDVPTVERMISEGTNTELRPIDEAIVAQQQAQADLFLKLGVLPKKITVRDVVLPAEEYARLIPGAGDTRKTGGQARITFGTEEKRTSHEERQNEHGTECFGISAVGSAGSRFSPAGRRFRQDLFSGRFRREESVSGVLPQPPLPVRRPCAAGTGAYRAGLHQQRCRYRRHRGE